MQIGDILIYNSNILGSWWTFGKEYEIIRLDDFNHPIVLDDDGDPMNLDGIIQCFKLKE